LRTVQGELERAAAEALGVDKLTVNGAGRTDAGVHARGQAASLVAETVLPARAVAAMTQKRLPRDIRIVEAADEPAGFHARHSARARRYSYRLLDHEDVLHGRYAWWPGRAVDGERLALGATPLIGEHDCSAFEAKGSSEVNPVCRISVARWRRWEAGWLFEVCADHFLYHMVRNLVGTALRAQRDPDPAARMADVLASRDRARSGGTVSPRGLCLEEVRFDEGGGQSPC
jgi:tRNA pseudouridine38-40 synthase